MATPPKYNFPADLYYADKTHLWVRKEDDHVTVGLHTLALETFGDIAYISTVSEGTTVQRGDVIGSIEAAKMVDELIAPVSGVIAACNQEAEGNPDLINTDPYQSGWIVKIKASSWESDAAELIHGDALDSWVNQQIEQLDS